MHGSFQGGASGPSQDQVYEAMQIFGEGIQDFDFMKPLDEEGADDEVRAAARKNTRIETPTWYTFQKSCYN